jgi:hypothetical protein
VRRRAEALVDDAVVRSRHLALHWYRRLRQRLQASASAPVAANIADEVGGATDALPGDPEVLVYFPDTPEKLYQLRDWFGVLQELHKHARVGILTRHPTTFRAVATETPLPVYLVDDHVRIGRALEAGVVSTVLYVNHNVSAYQLLRSTAVAHVHIGHGESEKVYMVANQLKAYDHVFVAGEAARDRLRANIRFFADDRVRVVGRPQFDLDVSPPAPTGSTILYAPTYEGDVEGMRYSSVDSMGEAIVDGLLRAGHQVIYRPHPLTGVNDPAFRSADERIRARVRAGGGVVDLDTPLRSLMATATLLVTDVSAALLDFLVLDRPVIVTDTGRGVRVSTESALDAAYRVGPDDASSISSVVHAALTADVLSTQRARARRHHFGDLAPGESLDAFVREVLAVGAAHRAWEARR